MRPVFDPIAARVREAARRLISGRQLARRRAYQGLFLGGDGRLKPDGEDVLADLRRFCRATTSTFDPDPRQHALLEGRREVVWRILAYLHIDEEQIIKIIETEIDDE